MDEAYLDFVTDPRAGDALTLLDGAPNLVVSRTFSKAHALAGLVMLGWIAGECLVLGVFMWPHALWGGVGAIQLLLVTVLMGAFRPQPGLRPRSARLPARERAAPPDS